MAVAPSRQEVKKPIAVLVVRSPTTPYNDSILTTPKRSEPFSHGNVSKRGKNNRMKSGAHDTSLVIQELLFWQVNEP